MKKLDVIFGAGVLGVVLSLVMTVVTGIQDARERAIPPSQVIPTPAIGQ